jgi:hypothetical protein
MRKQHVTEFRRLMSESLRIVGDPGLGLVFVHMNVPHPVGIYSRIKDHISAADESNYVDNLELADRTLGQLRRAMETAGVWEETTLLITSDHPLRTFLWSEMPGRWSQEEAHLTGNRQDNRVPFIVKLAGQNQAYAYPLPFNNVLAHDLVLAVLSGEIACPQDALTWLDNNRHRSLPLPDRERNLEAAPLISLRR